MPLVRGWRNNYDIWRWCRQNDFISDVEQAGWYERQTADPSIRMYKIVLITGSEKTPVGVCGLTSIDWQNRRAEFSLYIDPMKHKQGLGKQALAALLLHGFQNLGLMQIWGECFDGNPALKMFESLGFKKDGVRRQFYFKDGKHHDCQLVSILHSEWLGRQQPMSQPGGDSPGLRGGDSSEPERPVPTPPTKSVAGATSQTRIRKAGTEKPDNGPRRPVSLVERAGIVGPETTGPTIDV